MLVISFSSCKDDSTNPSNSNNNNSSSGGVQYFFDIEIGGIAHKLHGNTNNILIKGSSGPAGTNEGYRCCYESLGNNNDNWRTSIIYIYKPDK